MAHGAFLSDIETLRRRAREHIAQGAVTPGYHADRDVVLKLLNEALATEILCTLRYKRHHFMAKGIHAESVAAEFLEHARDESQHADQIAERIAIDSYREMIAYFGQEDPTSRRLLEEILAKEEEHADDLASLLEGLTH
jgi:bacterioferritin